MEINSMKSYRNKTKQDKRREKALLRLRAQLVSKRKPLLIKHLRTMTDQEYKEKLAKDTLYEPLTDSDIKRIKKEIASLESRVVYKENN